MKIDKMYIVNTEYYGPDTQLISYCINQSDPEFVLNILGFFNKPGFLYSYEFKYKKYFGFIFNPFQERENED